MARCSATASTRRGSRAVGQLDIGKQYSRSHYSLRTSCSGLAAADRSATGSFHSFPRSSSTSSWSTRLTTFATRTPGATEWSNTCLTQLRQPYSSQQRRSRQAPLICSICSNCSVPRSWSDRPSSSGCASQMRSSLAPRALSVRAPWTGSPRLLPNSRAHFQLRGVLP